MSYTHILNHFSSKFPEQIYFSNRNQSQQSCFLAELIFDFLYPHQMAVSCWQNQTKFLLPPTIRPPTTKESIKLQTNIHLRISRQTGKEEENLQSVTSSNGHLRPHIYFSPESINLRYNRLKLRHSGQSTNCFAEFGRFTLKMGKARSGSLDWRSQRIYQILQSNEKKIEHTLSRLETDSVHFKSKLIIAEPNRKKSPLLRLRLQLIKKGGANSPGDGRPRIRLALMLAAS